MHYFKLSVLCIFVAISQMVSLPRDVTPAPSRCTHVVVATSGNCVQLNCTTQLSFPVDWKFIPFNASHIVQLYMGGSLLQSYKGRMNVTKKVHGQYDLVINSVQTIDAGTYSCIDDGGFGDELAQIELVVIVGYPDHISNINLLQDGCFTKTACSDVYDSLNLSTSVAFIGNCPPFIYWKLNDTHSSIYDIIHSYSLTTATSSVVIPVDDVTSDDVYSVSMTSESCPFPNQEVAAGMSFTKTEFTHSWSSIQLDKFFSQSEHRMTREMCGPGIVMCSAAERSSCTFHWIDTATNKTVSKTRPLNLTSVSATSFSYQCVVQCVTRGKQCSKAFDKVVCQINSERYSTTVVTATVCIASVMLSLLTILSLVLVIRFKLYKRCCHVPKDCDCMDKSTHEEETFLLIEEEKQVTVLPTEILELLLQKSYIQIFGQPRSPCIYLPERVAFETLASVCQQWRRIISDRPYIEHRLRHHISKACLPFRRRALLVGEIDTQQRQVTGIAQLQENIFIVFGDFNCILRYHVNPRSSQYNQLTNIEVDGLQVASDMAACCVNICLYIADSAERCVWRVDPDEEQSPKKFLEFEQAPATLSVAKDGQLVVLNVDRSINIFTSDGAHVSSSNPLTDHNIPSHVLLTGSGDQIICGEQSDHSFSVWRRDEYIVTHDIYSEYSSISLIENTKYRSYLAQDYASNVTFVADFLNNRVLILGKNLRLRRLLLSGTDHGIISPSRLCYFDEIGQLLVAMGGTVRIYLCK